MFDFSKLKICILAGTLGQGGAERQLYYMLRTLKRRGADARVLCLTSDEFWQDRIKALGISITWVGRSRFRAIRLLRILSEVRKFRPDVLQSQHFYTNLYIVAASRLYNLREIGAMRNDGASEVRANRKIAGWLDLHGPRLLAANSWAAIEFAMQQGVPSSQLLLLPNVVDTQAFQPATTRSGSLQALAVGRLVPQKRLDRFLAALAQVRAIHGGKVTGVIVGTGPLRSELEQRARAMGLLPGGVEFRGAVSDTAPIYQQSQVCVLTSDHEGTPNALLEAMASGLPVVATRVGGVPQIVRDGETGLVVEAGDISGLAEALSRLVADKTLRTELGQRARAFIEENHSLGQLPDNLARLYDVATGGRRPVSRAPFRLTRRARQTA